MILGRFKLWFATRTVHQIRNNFWGRMAAQYTSHPKEDVASIYFVSKTKHWNNSKEWLGEGETLLADYGWKTYWIWRFSFTVRTPEYNLKNPW